MLKISGYDLLSPINEGGSAYVYRALQQSLERVVAVKILRSNLSHDAVARERFLRGGKHAARITHPHIIPIYETRCEVDHCFIAMEYLAGGDLKNRLREDLGTAKALDALMQIAAALEAAHDADIVHGDLKPGNILFRNDDCAVLTDFAGVVDGQISQSPDKTFASPLYMSPEQAKGQQATPASDMYSLGIILYEILCGAPPYRGKNAVDTARQQINAPIPKLDDEHSIFRPVIARMLAKDPFERYRSMGELIKKLEPLRDLWSEGNQDRTMVMPSLYEEEAEFVQQLAQDAGPHLYDTQEMTLSDSDQFKQPEIPIALESSPSQPEPALAPKVTRAIPAAPAKPAQAPPVHFQPDPRPLSPAAGPLTAELQMPGIRTTRLDKGGDSARDLGRSGNTRSKTPDPASTPRSGAMKWLAGAAVMAAATYVLLQTPELQPESLKKVLAVNSTTNRASTESPAQPAPFTQSSPRDQFASVQPGPRPVITFKNQATAEAMASRKTAPPQEVQRSSDQVINDEPTQSPQPVTLPLSPGAEEAPSQVETAVVDAGAPASVTPIGDDHQAELARWKSALDAMRDRGIALKDDHLIINQELERSLSATGVSVIRHPDGELSAIISTGDGLDTSLGGLSSDSIETLRRLSYTLRNYNGIRSVLIDQRYRSTSEPESQELFSFLRSEANNPALISMSPSNGATASQIEIRLVPDL